MLSRIAVFSVATTEPRPYEALINYGYVNVSAAGCQKRDLRI